MSTTPEVSPAWFARQYKLYQLLPRSPLPRCDKQLYERNVCCGWHAGRKLLLDHLRSVGCFLLRPHEVEGRVDGDFEVLSEAWFTVFGKRYPEYPIAMSAYIPAILPVVKWGDMPQWVAAAHKAHHQLEVVRQPWCNNDLFLFWACCMWHAGAWLMMEHLSYEARALLEPTSLPKMHNLHPDVFSAVWFEHFTSKYGLPQYRPY